jgi:hypothetical protein
MKQCPNAPAGDTKRRPANALQRVNGRRAANFQGGGAAIARRGEAREEQERGGSGSGGGGRNGSGAPSSEKEHSAAVVGEQRVCDSVLSERV